MANPFDQFATEVRAAVPDVAAPAAPVDSSNPFGAPAQAGPTSVMNAPPQMSYEYGGYGAPPPAAQPPMGQPTYSASPSGYGMPPQGAPPMSMAQQGKDPAMTNDFGGVQNGSAGFAAGPDAAFGAPSPAPAQPPAPSDPFGGAGAAYGGYDASQQFPPAQPPATDPTGMPGASPYGMPEAAPEAAPPSPAGNPFGAPPSQPSGGSMPPSPARPEPAASDNPFASPPQGAPPMPPQGAPPMPPQGAPPMPPQGAPPMPPQGGAPNPYNPSQSQQYSADPWGAPAPPPPGPTDALVPATDPMTGALVPAQSTQHQYGNVDPFAVFASAPAPPPAAPPSALVPAVPEAAPAPVAAPAPTSDDLWADMGFDAPVPDAPKPEETSVPEDGEAEKSVPSGELPPGGEWYDARIFTPTLGVMFFKPQELTDSLFLQTDKTIVDALEDRPVVAFIVEGSSARSAGVELGHVLLKVNGIDVKNPKEASRLIKEGPRPLPLLFYVPDTNVVIAEGEHMVKYDTKETTAPNSAKDWKPKYVVIGGIIAQPWMMNMYRSKSEYDIAVIETQARRPVSVKVKQFSLQGARIQNDWQGPQMVKYKNKLHPWKYIVVLPVGRNPIKISSPSLSQLKPVHEGIRRVLLAQQRDRGHHSHTHTAAPVREDPYSNRPQANGHGHGHHDDYHRQSHGGGGDPYGYAHGGGGGGARGDHFGDQYSGPQSGQGHHGDYQSRAGGDPYARPVNTGGDQYNTRGDPYGRF